MALARWIQLAVALRRELALTRVESSLVESTQLDSLARFLYSLAGPSEQHELLLLFIFAPDVR